jgi:hypothetical protein
MKRKLITIWMFLPLMLAYTGCEVEPEALEIQKLKTYDEQYYANLRAYKQSDHCLFFGWYAAWTPAEGVSGYKDPASWGERFLGLPDSLDIVAMWSVGGGADGQGGIIPSNDPNSDAYAPVAYADWKFVRETKGTRFVFTVGPKMNKVIKLKDGTEYDLSANHTDEGIAVYGQYLVDKILDNDVDGLDLDFEPSGDFVQQNEPFKKLVLYIGQYLGPKSNHPDKLLCIDFYSAGTSLSSEIEPYVNYFIRQAYSQGFTEHNATRLQSYYDQISWAPTDKFIVTEQLGVWYENAGSPFTEADGNTLTAEGTRMYSLEGMARWNPTQGRKAGFGGFYFDRDYYSKNGPYYNVRRCIQIANPAVY